MAGGGSEDSEAAEKGLKGAARRDKRNGIR
jgi:hypothetical protein